MSGETACLQFECKSARERENDATQELNNALWQLDIPGWGAAAQSEVTPFVVGKPRDTSTTAFAEPSLILLAVLSLPRFHLAFAAHIINFTPRPALRETEFRLPARPTPRRPSKLTLHENRPMGTMRKIDHVASHEKSNDRPVFIFLFYLWIYLSLNLR